MDTDICGTITVIPFLADSTFKIRIINRVEIIIYRDMLTFGFNTGSNPFALVFLHMKYVSVMIGQSFQITFFLFLVYHGEVMKMCPCLLHTF